MDGNIIGPKILGSSTGLSTFWVMFAILIGGGMFGFLGMLLGGCNLGARPIDQHIKAFESLGATVEVKRGNVYANRKERLKGNNIFLDVVSVGATMNAILAATLASGSTTIENCAKIKNSMHIKSMK